MKIQVKFRPTSWDYTYECNLPVQVGDEVRTPSGWARVISLEPSKNYDGPCKKTLEGIRPDADHDRGTWRGGRVL
jgi:hypothetical protein